MKFKQSCRKLLQEEPDPLHPILPPINDSSSSTPLSAAEVRRPFPPNTNPFDTSMALTILVLLTALFFMTFFSFYIRRYSSDHSDSNPNSNNNISHPVQRPTRRAAPPYSPSSSAQPSKGLDVELIHSLPTFPFGGAAKHRIECSICLSDFEDGETVKVIPHCGHAFHPPCIDTWLASHVSCPLCRSTQLFGGALEGVGRYTIDDGVGEESDGDNSGRSRNITAGDLRRTCSYSSLQNHSACLPRNSSF